MLTLCLIKRLCAGSLMLFAAFVTLTALVDSPTARADPRGAPAGRAAAAEFSDVTIVDFAFAPQVMTITAGSSVQWTNTGSFIHTATSDTAVWDSGDLASSGTFTQTFTVPGGYAYHCTYHLSMQGTIVVLEPALPLSVTLVGPHAGTHDTAYAFTATVNPITTSLPITFSWEAANQLPIMQVSMAVSDTRVFSWTSSLIGAQWITVTASTATGSASDTHLIIIDPLEVYLPLVVNSVGP